MANNQVTPNEIKYFNVKAGGVDITSMVIQADIFQEVFSPTWSAQLSFSDTQNLLMNVPIVPGTEVQIIMETDYPKNKKKSFKFVVYKISDRVQLKQEHQGYMISCVSKEFWKNQKKRVSKAYKNQPPQTIVSDIVNENGIGSLVAKDGDDKSYTVVVPNMSPFAAINWVSRFTKDPKGGADFWFFQSDDGEFKFKSLNNMLADRSGVKFKQFNPNLLDKTKNVPDEHFLNIEHYEFLTQHDVMTNYAGGYYANTVLSHDIYNKSFGSTTFEYGDDIPQDKERAPFESVQFEGSENSHIVYQAVSTNQFGINVLTPADTHGEWLGSRKTNVMKMEENRLVMTVPGVVSHYELLGKQVDVELPSHQDIDDQVYLDKYLKGSYVVTAVRHVVTPDYYKVVMELGKKRVEEAY